MSNWPAGWLAQRACRRRCLTAAKDALAGAEARLGYSVDHSALIKWLETLTPPEPAKSNSGARERYDNGSGLKVEPIILAGSI